ncbi:transposase [Micrococcales bacterium 31B]|nr:transposase [Micrococcales bacterium 31B]
MSLSASPRPGSAACISIGAGDGGESAKFWLGVLTEVKNRGVEDVCIMVCDGLKGLPDTITTPWELATVQTGNIRLIRHVHVCVAEVLGIRSPAISSRSIRPYPMPLHGRGSRSSRRSGARCFPRSGGCGRTCGRSSSRSWTTTSRSAASSARRTRWSPSAPATGGPCGRAGTFPTTPRR